MDFYREQKRRRKTTNKEGQRLERLMPSLLRIAEQVPTEHFRWDVRLMGGRSISVRKGRGSKEWFQLEKGGEISSFLRLAKKDLEG